MYHCGRSDLFNKHRGILPGKLPPGLHPFPTTTTVPVVYFFGQSAAFSSATRLWMSKMLKLSISDVGAGI